MCIRLKLWCLLLPVRWGWTSGLKNNPKNSDGVSNCNCHTVQMLMICALQERPTAFSHWMYCHLVMCSETCMSKPCCQSLTSQYVERIHWIPLGHYFITSTKGKACGWGRGWGARTIPSLQYAGSGGRWMSPTHPTHLSDHSTDLKQGHSHFPDRGCSLFSPGGFNSSLSVAQSGLQCQTPHHSHSTGQPVD